MSCQPAEYWNANYFDVVRADKPELLDAVYRLRYQVYCLEKGFEDASAHPEGRETDLDDERSIHTLLVHRRTGAHAGTVRVILPDRDRFLPTQHILARQGLGLLRGVPLNSTGEISRFLVSKEFRRRPNEESYADVAGPTDRKSGDRRTAPYITFGLIRGVLQTCNDFGLTHICAAMEPALIRILYRFGLEFEEIGEPVDHRGVLQPCLARLTDLVERNRARSTPLWQYSAAPTSGSGKSALRAA